MKICSEYSYLAQAGIDVAKMPDPGAMSIYVCCAGESDAELLTVSRARVALRRLGYQMSSSREGSYIAKVDPVGEEVCFTGEWLERNAVPPIESVVHRMVSAGFPEAAARAHIAQLCIKKNLEAQRQ